MQAGRDLRFPRRFELSNGADLIEPQPPRSPDPRSYAATAFGHMAVLSRNRKLIWLKFKNTKSKTSGRFGLGPKASRRW